ncbi:hypothetical protein GOBAR_AA34387 [Gossypium barbadense]|uniref:Uncharacterized protein n=1 Tax=Gossypium barbadense TaxID=3634 RepID=A0A2P5W5E5_GOSBA|nr:hypothetical protein GOBAR_AA34387 [Gossypium barbadense]
MIVAYCQEIPAEKPCLMPLEINGQRLGLTITAIDGTSDCSGEPNNAPIPRIMAGTFKKTGIEGVCPSVSIESKR